MCSSDLLADVAAALTLEHDGLKTFCAEAVVNTDDRNELALRSLKGQSRASAERPSLLAHDVFAEQDPLIDRPGKRSLLAQLSIDPAAVVRRMARTQFSDRAARVIENWPNQIEQAKARGMLALSKGEVMEARNAFVDVLLARPNDRTARFKLMEPMLQLAGNPQAPREFLQLVSGSDAVELAVVEAAKKYAQRDFVGLRSIDGQLSLARPNDACFPQALLFRALWRSKVTNAERKAELGREEIGRAHV